MPVTRNNGSPGPIFSAAHACRTRLRACVRHEALMRDQWAETRLADFNLWASGIGALAVPKASLDRRLDFRSDARDVILSALRRLQKEADRCTQLAQIYNRNIDMSALSTGRAAACEIDSLLSTAMSEVEAFLEQLLRLSVAIRRSGTQARLMRADQSLEFQPHSELYMLLLSKIVASQKRTTSAVEHTPSVPASVTITQLDDVQRRLIYANLKRRNRFIYAQKHSRVLATYEEAQVTDRDRSRKIFESVKSAVAWILIKVFVLLLLCVHVASQARRLMLGPNERIAIATSTLTRPRTPDQKRPETASDFSRLPATAPLKEIPSDAMTQLSTTTKSLEYPQPPAVDSGSKGFMCPCCCQTLPVMFAKDSFWKKHIREDLAPYTCVMPDCPSPLTLYSSKEDWKDHLQHGHTQNRYWLCPLCPKSVKQEPGSDVPAVSITQFDDEANFEGHLVSEHPSAEKHIASIKDQSRRSAPMDIDQCPLCPFPGNAKAKVDRLALLDHIANDVHAFSLYSLPWPADDSEEGSATRATTDHGIGQWLGNCASAGQHDHGDLSSGIGDEDELLSAGEGDVAMEPLTAAFLRCISGEISHAIEAGALQVDPTQKSGRYKDTFFEKNAYFSQFDNDSNGATVPGSHAQSSSARSDSRAHLEHDDFSYEERPPSNNIPFPRNPDFVERTTLTRRICAQLAVPAGRAALTGMSGVGKTQLALECAYRLRELWPQTRVIWVDADSEAALEQSLRNNSDFSVWCHRKYERNIWKLLQKWLSEESNWRWIVIFINADAIDALLERPETVTATQRMDYIPHREHGSVLITTRDKNGAQKLVNESDIIEVPMMGEQEAEALLMNKLGQASEHGGPDAQRLVRMLEYHPLTIAQAAAYLLHHSPGCSIRQYCEELERSHHPIISGMWEALFEHILKVRKSAADLLMLLSFCDPVAIPKTLMDEGDSDGTETSEDDIQVLLSLSLVSATVDPEVFKMHRLVQNSIRVWLEVSGRLQNALHSFVHRMYTLFPGEGFKGWTNSKCYVLVPHAMSLAQHRPVRRDSQLEWASVMHNATKFAQEQGYHDNALALATSALQVRLEQLSEVHSLTLRSKVKVAEIYYEQGRWHEAKELQEEVVGIRQKFLGEEHPDTMGIMNALARTYFSQGQLEEAEKLQVEVLKTSRRAFGSAHPIVIGSLRELARTYSAQGWFVEAGTLLEEALQATKKTFGSSAWETLEVMDELESSYCLQTRYAEALTLQEEVVTKRKELYGEAHPDTLVSMVDLALTYSTEDRNPEATEILEYVAEGQSEMAEDDMHRLALCRAGAARRWRRWRGSMAVQMLLERIYSPR